MSNMRPFVRRIFRAKTVPWPSYGRRRATHNGRPVGKRFTKPRPGGLWRLWQIVTRDKEPLG